HTDDVLGALEGRHQHPDRRKEPQHRDRDHYRRQDALPLGRRRAGAAARLTGTADTGAPGSGGDGTHQYSVWPRSSRNWSRENPRMIIKSTQAIAVAEPKWKKFRKAVS